MNRLKLTIDNSMSKIAGLTREEFTKIKGILSYKPNDYYSGRGFVRPKYLIDKNGNFPTGLLYLVKDYLKLTNLLFDKLDLRRTPTHRGGLFNATWTHCPREEQLEASEAFMRVSRGVIAAVTGSGKSLIVALIIQKLQVPTLVVVPSLLLKKQLTDSLTEIFGKSLVGPNKPIWVQNIDSISTTKVLAGYDCVILDEFHRAASATYRKLNQKCWNKVFYRCGLTGTPFRSQDNEKILLESVLSKVIYRLDYHKAVAKGYIVPIEGFAINVPKQPTKQVSWQGVYKELVVNNAVRNEMIAEMLINLNEAGKSTLCLVKEIVHGEILSKKTDLFFANGESEDTPHLLRMFNEGKIKCLIGTTGVMGEGLDTRPAEYIIIAGLGKSKNAIIQQIGRSLRLYPGKESGKIVIFFDKSHRFTVRHFKEQAKILIEEYGISIHTV